MKKLEYYQKTGITVVYFDPEAGRNTFFQPFSTFLFILKLFCVFITEIKKKRLKMNEIKQKVF